MNHRIILRSAAIVAILYGLILVFAPNTLMAMYGSEQLEGTGYYFGMLSGGMLLGWGAMNWSASNAPQLAEIHYVMQGNIVAESICFLVSLYRQLTYAAAPTSGWLNVALFLVFAALFSWLYLSSPAGHRLHARGRPA